MGTFTGVSGGQKIPGGTQQTECVPESKYAQKVLFLELGVGRMTPMFIQEPFWNMTYALPDAFYITVNPRDAFVPDELKGKGLAIHEDIAKVLSDVRSISGEEPE